MAQPAHSWIRFIMRNRRTWQTDGQTWTWTGIRRWRDRTYGAAARGVDAEGGYLLGIAPRFFDEPGILYQHCTEFIMTETMRERKHLLEEKSQATIVVPGGIGTYEEFFEILTLKSLNRLDRAIVFYNINGYYDLMRQLLEHTAKEKFMEPAILDMCKFMDKPEEILDYIEQYFAKK